MGINNYSPIIKTCIRSYLKEVLATGRFNIENSYIDFHAPGVNYLCLYRSPTLTLKLYELPITDGKAIVSPHNHAYNFDTILLSGSFINVTYYEVGPEGSYYRNKQYYKRTFRSKLNNGEGFSKDIILCELELKHGCSYFNKLDHYFCETQDIHTLIVREPTLLFLAQYEDILTETSVYTETKDAPSTDGLYKRMTLEKAQLLLTKAKSLI